MSLHSGIDTVAIISHGVFTKTYGVDEEANLANLYASQGYLEDAPNLAHKFLNLVYHYMRHF